MKLPNKAVSYKKSILPLFPIILEVLYSNDYSPRELYIKLYKKIDSITLFTDSVTCLYALRKIDMNENGMLYYVKTN